MTDRPTIEGGRRAASSEVSIGLKLDFEVMRDDEVDAHVSYCPALDLYSQGDTDHQAIENIHEAVTLFLRSCYERGTLNRVLQDCGFTLSDVATRQQNRALVLMRGERYDAETAAPAH